MLYLGTRYLDFRSTALEYGQEVMLPFYILHQPVVIAIAFFVVRWEAGIGPKALTIVVGAFAVTLGLAEVLRRIRLVRALLGMKTRRRSVPTSGARQPAQPAS
jgi:hypothetical protein